MLSVKGRKYQPDTRDGFDYLTGDAWTGWKCLHFMVSEPQYYQLGYQTGGPPVTVVLPHGGSPPGLSGGVQWNAYARGDIDGDGIYSWFLLQGAIKNDQFMMAPNILIQDEEE
jgi:type IV pilus assembly protein PilA